MYAVCSGVGAGPFVPPACASHVSAACRSLPRNNKLASRFFSSHSRARTSSRVWSRVHARSVCNAAISRSNAASKSSPSRKSSQLCRRKASWITWHPSGTSRRTIGISRLLQATAWSTSSLHGPERANSGLITKMQVSAASMAALISCCQSAESGMPAQSTQALSVRCSSAL